MVMEGDLTWGGEHTVQCADDVLWNSAPETCVILLRSVTPINSIKKIFFKCSVCFLFTDYAPILELLCFTFSHPTSL